MRRFLFFCLFLFCVNLHATTGSTTYTAAGVGFYVCNWTVTPNTTARTVTITLQFDPRPDGNPWPAYAATGWINSTSTIETGYMNSFVDVRSGGTRTVTDVSYNLATGINLQFAWFGNEGVSPVTVYVPFDDSPQTCTISNTGAPDVSGHTITGTASGAHGGNPYNISIISGPASAAINSTTGAYSITATGAGVISYMVWISGGNGYLRSNNATGGGTVGASNKIKVTIPANHSDFPIIYTLTQGGEVVGTFTQPAGGDPYILSLDVGASAGTVTMTSAYSGVKYVDNSLVVSPGSTADTGVTNTFTPSTNPTTTPATPPAGSTGGSGGAKDPSNPANNSGTVWTNSGQSTTDPTTQTDLLTNSTFRQGVDKQVAAIQGINSALVSSSDIPADPTPETAPSTSAMDGLPTTVDGILGKLPTAPPAIAPLTSVSPVFTSPVFTIHGEQYSASFDFAPYATAIGIFRTLCIGIMSIVFFIIYVKTLRSAFAS